MFSKFWLLRGWGDLGDSFKKENFVIYIFVQIVLNEILNSCNQRISSDVKQQEIKELVAESCNFLYKHL